MTEGFMGEIRAFASDETPPYWLPCDGRRLPISGYQALFAIFGVAFGGDGRTNFALPDLRDMIAIHRPEYETGHRIAIAEAPPATEVQELLALNFCICVHGVFPLRS
jgi:microcystin-dependent protein